MILRFHEMEYSELVTTIGLTEPYVWCELRKKQSGLTIPCRHTIKIGYIIDIKQL